MKYKECIIVRERKYKSRGYVLRDEDVLSHFEDKPAGHRVLLKRHAYTFDGAYIGRSVFAYHLWKRGIIPELKNSDSTICSIGFCEREQKWYGWSHRAICGFGIGDMIFEEDFGDDRTPFISHGEVEIINLLDARQAAVNFANYVA